MLYFAFGSNMSSKRLQGRVPSARFEAVARLSEHRLCFHKLGADGSGKGDAEYTGNPDDEVVGVVYEISEAEKPGLDAAEGLGTGYGEKWVEIVAADGRELSAVMYFAIRIDPSVKPYHWYKNHVLVGAEENRLPADYTARIKAIASVDDPDPHRAGREWDMYHDNVG